MDLWGPKSLLYLSKEPSGAPNAKQALRAAARLKDKSTNVVVNPVRFKDLPLQTPAIQPGRAQLPQTPPPKRPRPNAPKQLSISSSHYLSGPRFASAKPTLEDQGFPNVLLASRPNHQRLGVPSTSTRIRIPDHSQPSHEPPRQSDILEQPSVKDSALNFIGKAKGAVTDTTRATVKLLPSLVLHKPQIKREPKTKSLRQAGTEVRPGCNLRVISQGKDIRSRDYKEVTSASDLEDNYRKVSSILSKEYTPQYTTLEVGESCQNLLGESTSNRSRRGIIYAANSYETSEASDVEMSTSRSNSRESVLPSTSADSWGRQRRCSRNRRKHIFYNDAEQGFEGDIEMYTGEDDFDLDAQDTEDSRVIRVNPLTLSQEDLDADSDGDCAVISRGHAKKTQGNFQMGSDSEGNTPANVRYGRLMQVALATGKHQPPRQSSGKRHLPTVKGPSSKSFLWGHKRVSLLDGPPEDISNLSEDELCSPKYIIGYDASGDHHQKTVSKPKGYEKKLTQQSVRGKKKSVAEPMELD